MRVPKKPPKHSRHGTITIKSTFLYYMKRNAREKNEQEKTKKANEKTGIHPERGVFLMHQQL